MFIHVRSLCVHRVCGRVRACVYVCVCLCVRACVNMRARIEASGGNCSKAGGQSALTDCSQKASSSSMPRYSRILNLCIRTYVMCAYLCACMHACTLVNTGVVVSVYAWTYAYIRGVIVHAV